MSGKTILPMTTPFVAILLLTAIVALGVAVSNQVVTASKYHHGRAHYDELQQQRGTTAMVAIVVIAVLATLPFVFSLASDVFSDKQEKENETTTSESATELSN